jgi:hypothetical protein
MCDKNSDYKENMLNNNTVRLGLNLLKNGKWKSWKLHVKREIRISRFNFLLGKYFLANSFILSWTLSLCSFVTHKSKLRSKNFYVFNFEKRTAICCGWKKSTFIYNFSCLDPCDLQVSFKNKFIKNIESSSLMHVCKLFVLVIVAQCS